MNSDDTDKRVGIVGDILFMLDKLTVKQLRCVLWFTTRIWAK